MIFWSKYIFLFLWYGPAAKAFSFSLSSSQYHSNQKQCFLRQSTFSICGQDRVDQWRKNFLDIFGKKSVFLFRFFDVFIRWKVWMSKVVLCTYTSETICAKAIKFRDQIFEKSQVVGTRKETKAVTWQYQVSQKTFHGS